MRKLETLAVSLAIGAPSFLEAYRRCGTVAVVKGAINLKARKRGLLPLRWRSGS